MFTERRKHPRFKIAVPVEVHAEGQSAPIHCSTSDLSLDGCYIESMYPFASGTKLELKLEAGDTLLILGRVITCDPQFGNGILFTKVLPEDLNTLGKFLDGLDDQRRSAIAK
jgi:PilZ domain-containing protein